jgi:hypothetical protein
VSDPFPLPDHGLPGLADLLTGNRWGAWATDGRVFPLPDAAALRAAVGYLRLKPGNSCRLFVAGPEQAAGAEGDGDGFQPPSGALVHLYANVARAQEAFSKAHPHAFLCEASAAVVHPYPHDPELPDLAEVYDLDRLRRALGDLLPDHPVDAWRLRRRMTRLTLLAYKPGRRAVLRADLALRARDDDDRKAKVALHLKVEAPAHVGDGQARLAAVRSAVVDPQDWDLPVPLGRADAVSVRGWIAGTHPLRDSGAASATLERLGEALAGLHRLDVPSLPAPPDPAGELKALASDLAWLVPGAAPRLDALAAELTGALAADAGAPATLHGDLHPEQFLEADGRLTLIDLDRACRGPAALDLGNLLATLAEPHPASPSQRAALLRGYGGAIDPAQLAAAEAFARLRRASVPWRQLSSRWPTEVTARIAAAQAALEGA